MNMNRVHGCGVRDSVELRAVRLVPLRVRHVPMLVHAACPVLSCLYMYRPSTGFRV